MEGFTIIDGVVAVVIVLSALLAYSRGLVREAMAIVGWVAAAVVAFLFAPQVEPLVRELPVVGEMIADSCELSIIGAFAIVFAVALIVVSLFTPLFSSLVQRSVLGGVDQGLGFIFGVIRGVLLVAIAFFVYSTVVVGDRGAVDANGNAQVNSKTGYSIVDESRSARVFGRFTTSIEEQNPEQALGWITSRYEALVGNCGQ